jgi:hypothetical protein
VGTESPGFFLLYFEDAHPTKDVFGTHILEKVHVFKKDGKTPKKLNGTFLYTCDEVSS